MLLQEVYSPKTFVPFVKSFVFFVFNKSNPRGDEFGYALGGAAMGC